MNVRMDMRGWVRVTWLLAAFVIGGIGVGWIWWPAAQELSQRHAHALELYDEANSIDTATRRASQLRAAQARVKADLAELGGLRSAGAVTAAVLRLLHEESKRQAVEIREIAPDVSSSHTTAANAMAPSPVRKDVLAGSDVSIAVRGPFRNIVALVADLPRHDVLLDVHDIQLASMGTDQKPPILDVTLHSTIYRLIELPTIGSSRVRTIR